MATKCDINDCESIPAVLKHKNTRRLACHACFFLARVENVTNGQTHIGGWVENVTNGQTHRGKKGDTQTNY